MEKKVESEVVEDPETEVVVDESTGDDQTKKIEKTFKQADVSRIVADEVRKEKNKFKAEKESWEAERTSYEEKFTEYENLLKGMVEEMKKDLPDEYKEILNDSSVLRQYQILSKKQNQVSKKTIPATPKPNSDGEKNVNSKPINQFRI
jgi:hypothetical protein